MSLFNKADEGNLPDTGSAPKSGQSRLMRSKSVSVIGPTLVFKGELSADEDLIIEGQIEGTIAHHKKHLTVGEQGRVTADIHASSVIVLGTVVGDIHSESVVSLTKSSDVKGNIYCARIAMEDGARFEGRIDMGEREETPTVPKKPVDAEPDGLSKAEAGAKKS